MYNIDRRASIQRSFLLGQNCLGFRNELNIFALLIFKLYRAVLEVNFKVYFSKLLAAYQHLYQPDIPTPYASSDLF